MARRPALNQPDKPRQPARQHEAPMLPPGVVPSRYGGLLDQRHIDPSTCRNAASEPQRGSVDADTLIKRPDLGPDARTFVAAGQQVPLGLEDNDREPA